jgi:uncharacterized protein (DUF1778 family)
MTQPKADRKRLTGSAAMQARGFKPVLLHLTKEEKELLEQAAELDGRKQTQFVRFYTLEAARRIVSKHQTATDKVAAKKASAK